MNLRGIFWKKITGLILGTAVFFALFSATASAATTEPLSKGATQAAQIAIYLNNEKIVSEQTPLIVNGRTLLPLRTVFESMGATVDYDNTTKTVTAARKDNTVRLTIGNSTAYINNEAITLDAPAISWNSRTYIPLRFVGEAFGATVNWDQSTKRIDISLKNAGIDEVSDLELSLNDHQLVLESAFLYKENYYIPFEQFLDYMDQYLASSINFSWTRIGTDYVVIFNGQKYTINADSKTVTVGQAKTELTNSLKTYQYISYMPLSLLRDLFSASYTQDKTTKAIKIYINRPKFNQSSLTIEDITIPTPTLAPAATLSGSRILTVSDNPEILNPDNVPYEDAVLWNSNIVSQNNVAQHRVFGWHINNMDQTVYIGITLENLGRQNILVSEAKGIFRTSPNSWSNYDVGMPIAEAVLAGTMDNSFSKDAVISPGETLLIKKFTLTNGSLIGFINDFSISNKAIKNGSFEYIVRVVISTDAEMDLTVIKSDPLPLSEKTTHPRGNWSSSTLFNELPLYTVGDREIAYNISNGKTDNLYTVDAALPATGDELANSGHFGANYTVRVPVQNDSEETKTVRIRLSARGGVYCGVVRTPNGVFWIPVMQAAKQVCNLYDYQAPPGQSYVDLELMHAGGSNLAVAVDLMTLE